MTPGRSCVLMNPAEVGTWQVRSVISYRSGWGVHCTDGHPGDGISGVLTVRARADSESESK